MSGRHLTYFAVVGLVVLMVGIVAYAVAQPATPAAPGGAAGGFQGGPPGGRMMMRMMGGGAPAIAVTETAVFVVSGNALYKYDAETLELLAQAEIPRPQMPMIQGGGGQPGQ